MSTLKFARELAQFEERLDWLSANGGSGYRDLDSALAASYKTLIEGLIELDEDLESAGLGAGSPSIPDILARPWSCSVRRKQHPRSPGRSSARRTRHSTPRLSVGMSWRLPWSAPTAALGRE